MPYYEITLSIGGVVVIGDVATVELRNIFRHHPNHLLQVQLGIQAERSIPIVRSELLKSRTVPKDRG